MSHAHAHADVCLCHEKGQVCNCDHSHDEGHGHGHGHEATTTAHAHSHEHVQQTFGQKIRPYSRLITTIVVVLAFGIGLSLLIGFSWLSVMEYWMGGYFVAFGVQQALSLKKSAAMFQQYDPLAKRVKAYAYALPFIQIALGLAYFFMVWWAVVGLVSLAVLLTNVIGVDNVLKRKQVVRCGCLGEGMNVPVSHVTLWENLIMIGMVVMMLAYHLLSYMATGGTDSTSMPGMNM